MAAEFPAQIFPNLHHAGNVRLGLRTQRDKLFLTAQECFNAERLKSQKMKGTKWCPSNVIKAGVASLNQMTMVVGVRNQASWVIASIDEASMMPMLPQVNMA